MIFGYARASTQEQNLNAQLDALEAAGCERIYQEKISGTKKERPELNEMLKQLREGDTVIVYKLDRISRSTKHLIELADLFKEKGVHFISLKDDINTTNAMGRFFFTMMAGIAQLERDIISERTKSGLESARLRGRSGGRPKADKKKIQTALSMYDSKKHTISEITAACGISAQTLYRYIRKRP